MIRTQSPVGQWSNYALLDCAEDRRGPVVHPHLSEDVLQMPLHRPTAEHKGIRDLGVAPALGHKDQDLQFPSRQAEAATIH